LRVARWPPAVCSGSLIGSTDALPLGKLARSATFRPVYVVASVVIGVIADIAGVGRKRR
jgi:hypothetical protein